MAMSEKPEKISPQGDGDQNVEKIRDILFGAQIRDYEARFARLEERLAAENEKMGQFLEKRLTGIATATQRELAGLAGQLEEQKQRVEAQREEARKENESARHQIGERLNDLDELLARESRNLRNELAGQHNELAALIRETREALDRTLTHERDRLEHLKVGREDLAGLLQALAAQLRPDEEQGG